MRLFELTEQKSKPILFLDMDGVLCDLFGYAAEIHDVEHYNQMTQADFAKFFNKNHIEAKQLFSNLPLAPNAYELLDIIKKYAGSFNILSSPLTSGDEGAKQGSIIGKKNWLAKHNINPKHAIFEHDKYKYAVQSDGTPNILIDDYGKNIRLWNQAGGIAIKYQADEDSPSKVEEALKKIYT